MQYTYLGKSNMQVSKVCIGTMHFGNRTSEEESFAIMDKALEMGINFFDTANVYGGQGNRGGSETIIGKWFQKRPGARDKIVLATKVYGQMTEESGLPNEGGGISRYKVRKHAEDSLRRLQTDRIDLYQVHHIDRRITPEEFWGTFETLTNDGKVIYMGGSNYSGWGITKHQMEAMDRGSMGFVSEQTMYSLVCRAPELELLPACEHFGIGVIPYMPLAGGILTGKVKSEPGSRTSDVEGEYGISVEDERMNKYRALCADIGEEPHVVAIAWTLAHPAVDSPIVGVRTVKHLEGLDRATELKLDQETLDKLDDIYSINDGRPLRKGQAPEAYAW